MYEQSIQGYDEALRFGAQDAFTYHNRGGLAYFSLGQYERSLAGFARALRLHPLLAGAYTRRVVVFTLMSLDPEARRALDQAVEVGVERLCWSSTSKSLKMVR